MRYARNGRSHVQIYAKISSIVSRGDSVFEDFLSLPLYITNDMCDVRMVRAVNLCSQQPSKNDSFLVEATVADGVKLF